MLLSTFSSPRRLILLAVFLFFAIIVFIRNTSYSAYLPKYDIPTFTHGDAAVDGKPNDATQDKPKDGMWQPYKPGKPDAPVPSQKWDYVEDAPVHTASPAAPTHSVPASVTPIAHASHQETQERIQKLIDWTPLNTPNHWPGWGDYKDKDYDPNRWEGLEWDNGFYESNGIHRLDREGLSPKTYFPYPAYNSEEWEKQWKGQFASCKGPRGDDLNDTSPEMVKAYSQLPHDFPNITIGSAEAVGLDAHSCFDRDNRYLPYGLDTADGFDWTSVWWGQLQNECLQRNKDRYADTARAPMQIQPSRSLPKDHDKWHEDENAPSFVQEEGPKPHPRTAVLIRTWEGYSYTENDMQAIRALVTELSLLSGGEYQLYLLVNVKEREADIYNNPQVYQDVLKRVVPRELRDISVLWTERVCEEWYPKVNDWQVYWMQFMPLQWFSKTHPEFDYIWNWETDARYTGNHYHFLEQISAFAKSMPRKHLWERNSRFYFPSVHGDFASYLADTDAAIDSATAAGTMTPVWGPLVGIGAQTPVGPTPPTSESADDYSWGVDEEADLITLQPIWDPSQTEWSYRHKIWNFEPGVHPVFSDNDPVAEGFFNQGYDAIPRRTFINTVARFSKRMLHAMHIENLAGRSMQAEMWPATVALHHGLKAVYTPHPIWTDRKWPAWYLDAIFNADGGKQARWGQQIDSPYNHDREANFRGWSWYYASWFPSVLYRRFLGWVAEDGGMGKLGGEDFERVGTRMGDGNMVGGEGRMCLPGMLLHPVKKVVQDQ